MKIVNEAPISILADEGKILVQKNETPEIKHLSNTFITLAKNDKIDNYIELDITDINITSKEIMDIQYDLDKENADCE